MNDELKVFINKDYSGNLNFENDQYVFNYKYDVITTTIYIKNDIPALRLSDGKLWWKERTYKIFAKQSCNLSNSEYDSILKKCEEEIIKTKKEIFKFKQNHSQVKEFLENLSSCWDESIN